MFAAEYIPIFVFAIVALCFVVAAITLGFVLDRRLSSHNKLTAYECGIVSDGNAKRPFPVKFFLIAVLFLLFDVETVFFFPWALSLRNIGWLGFSSMLIFILTLAVGYIFELKTVKF